MQFKMKNDFLVTNSNSKKISCVQNVPWPTPCLVLSPLNGGQRKK